MLIEVLGQFSIVLRTAREDPVPAIVRATLSQQHAADLKERIIVISLLENFNVFLHILRHNIRLIHPLHRFRHATTPKY